MFPGTVPQEGRRVRRGKRAGGQEGRRGRRSRRAAGEEGQDRTVWGASSSQQLCRCAAVWLACVRASECLG